MARRATRPGGSAATQQQASEGFSPAAELKGERPRSSPLTLTGRRRFCESRIRRISQPRPLFNLPWSSHSSARGCTRHRLPRSELRHGLVPVARGADRKTPKVVVRYEMYDERRSSNQEDARDLWERTREDAQNDSEAFGLLLSR